MTGRVRTNLIKVGEAMLELSHVYDITDRPAEASVGNAARPRLETSTRWRG